MEFSPPLLSWNAYKNFLAPPWKSPVYPHARAKYNSLEKLDEKCEIFQMKWTTLHI